MGVQDDHLSLNANFSHHGMGIVNRGGRPVSAENMKNDKNSHFSVNDQRINVDAEPLIPYSKSMSEKPVKTHPQVSPSSWCKDFEKREGAAKTSVSAKLRNPADDGQPGD